jgi:hypothetical protein
VTRGGLRALVGDLRQLASVRRIVLDDGPEAGVRALAFSTGGGLDFWVLTDRTFDLGPVWFRGVPTAWQSPAGFRSPTLHHSEEDGGRGFNRGFSGFLVTCGLDHVRQPAGGHPLHGRLPFTPARVTAYGEDWERPEPVLYGEGEVVQARYGGEALRLRRRIEAPIGGCEIRVEDEVENVGAEPSAQATLYHFNLGFPVAAAGTEIRIEGSSVFGPISLPDPQDQPASVSYPVGGRPWASCSVETPSEGGEHFQLTLGFATATLPYLQLWRDLRPNAGVLAVEPCTSERRPEGMSGPEAILEPGERRRYSLRLQFAGLLAPIDRALLTGQVVAADLRAQNRGSAVGVQQAVQGRS